MKLGQTVRNRPGTSGKYTEKEIWNQPDLWKKIYDKIKAEAGDIAAFLHAALEEPQLNIILSGAGTSAFIGLSLSGVFTRTLNKTSIAISTTDLVTHPLDYFKTDSAILLVSFARSGNSPESVAAAELADQLCTKVFHLIITCDANGALANFNSPSSKYVVVLPPESNDRSLVMTSSYTGMLLAALLIARLSDIEKLEKQIAVLQHYALKIFKQSETFERIAHLNFERIVFLGSGPLYGTATESQLKVQEMTDGKIICKNDSFLGIRHGPKVVIDNSTLVFLLFSNEKYVSAYECDLLESLATDSKPLAIAAMLESGKLPCRIDHLFLLSDNGKLLEEDLLPVCFVLPSQLIGYYKSLQLGLDPDLPSVTGVISRVVQGVHIYPFPKKVNVQ
jgi:tagatose-6-phosphate ketose/aldose isomerase